MTIFYSSSSRGFYHASTIADVPSDSVEISESRYDELLDGQSSGKIITAGSDGFPILRNQSPTPLAEQISSRRFIAEVSGTIFDGVSFETTRDSQSLIAGAALAAVIDPKYSCNWKSGGEFIHLDSSQLIGAASAVRLHVQSCFDREKELLSAINDGVFTEEMLGEGWP